MPTAKPRLQVTLTVPQYELLKRLAQLQKRSMSKLFAELFEQVHPVLERVAVVMQAAVRAQESVKEGLRESTEQAEKELAPLFAQAMSQLDLLQENFEGTAARAADASTASVAGREGPPPSNTGGRTTKHSNRAPKRSISRRVKKRAGKVRHAANAMPTPTVYKTRKGVPGK